MNISTNITGEVQFIEACLKTVRGFKGINIHNICNGDISFVPYGALDIATCLVGAFIFISLIVFMTIAVFQ